jgi:alkanesulfonate monooxygenase SsuD/methylene tetrahydromethanopterin reductase-like flavin-dependent oxidoreductase (luciferase family)
MRFQLVINMERFAPSQDMAEIERHTLDMVRMADEGGFDIVWAAEHHALEMLVAPNPFQMLTWWAAHTSRIRLGTAVVVAAYWHPIRLAGEAALCDLYSGGRLEFGIGSGAYQREFDRMRPGVEQKDGYSSMHEMLPALKGLWAGDYTHDGEIWSFPTATSVPKPVQTPHPPIWVAARSPLTYDWAVANECNILSWPLTRPFSELERYKEMLEEALTNHPGKPRPTFAAMRYTAVCGDRDQLESVLNRTVQQTKRFENLFKNLGDVRDGFTQEIDLDAINESGEFDREAMRENLMFGTPDQVIAKLEPYAALGVDHFTYCASFGLDMAAQKRSLRLFIDEVMPAFGDGASA